MADKIQTIIPQYGELNRIYRDYTFEAAVLELVLDRQKEQYTLILNSLKTEIEKSIQAYETRPISDSAIERVCYQHMERHSNGSRCSKKC